MRSSREILHHAWIFIVLEYLILLQHLQWGLQDSLVLLHWSVSCLELHFKGVCVSQGTAWLAIKKEVKVIAALRWNILSDKAVRYSLWRCHVYVKAKNKHLYVWNSSSLSNLSECNQHTSSKGGVQSVYPPRISQSEMQRHTHVNSWCPSCSFICPVCAEKTLPSRQWPIFSLLVTCVHCE